MAAAVIELICVVDEAESLDRALLQRVVEILGRRSGAFVAGTAQTVVDLQPRPGPLEASFLGYISAHHV